MAASGGSQKTPYHKNAFMYVFSRSENEIAAFKVVNNTRVGKYLSVEIKHAPGGSTDTLDHFLIGIEAEALESFEEEGDTLRFDFNGQANFNIPEKFNDLPQYSVLQRAKREGTISLSIDTERVLEKNRQALREHVESLRRGGHEVRPMGQRPHRTAHFLTHGEYYLKYMHDVEAELSARQNFLDKLFLKKVDVIWEPMEPDHSQIECTIRFQEQDISRLELWNPDDDQVFWICLPRRVGWHRVLKLNILSDQINSFLNNGTLMLTILKANIDAEMIEMVEHLRRERDEISSENPITSHKSFEYTLKAEASQKDYNIQKKAFSNLLQLLKDPESDTHIKLDWVVKGQEDIPARSTGSSMIDVLTHLESFKLDRYQEEAVTRVLCDETTSGITLISGPSGTGKSKALETIVSISTATRAKLPILYCCPYNTPLHQVARRLDLLLPHGRILQLLSRHAGAQFRPREDNSVPRYSPALLRKRWMDTHPTHELTARFWTTHPFDHPTHNGLGLFEGEEGWDEIDDQIWRNADIVICTVGMALSESVGRTFRPKMLILDEAFAVTEGMTLALMLKFRPSLEISILAGDPCQQQPFSLRFNRDNLLSMAGRLEKGGWGISRLRTNHRTDPHICNLLREYAYHSPDDKTGQKEYYLENSDHVLQRHNHFVASISNISGVDVPQVWINVIGTEGVLGYGTPFNMAEVRVVKEVVQALLTNESVPAAHITVLTPYTGQVRKLREALRTELLQGITLASLQSYQGNENELIIFSLVRSNEGGDVSTLSFAADAVRGSIIRTLILISSN
ncbi:NFX1-type zinc finger-containing protein 1 [Arthrobotrys megalospora]